MADYPIFPSISRAPSFESTRKLEDGTLKDPMESGYVATRPRFTRLRRTFGVSYKFLSAEDVRALDRFETLTVQGGAGAFYLPNLIRNGSFEVIGPDGELVGWQVLAGAGNPYSVSQTTNAYDGSNAIKFSLNAITLTAGEDIQTLTSVECAPVSVSAGDSYLAQAYVNMTNAPPANVALPLYILATVTYSDGTRVNRAYAQQYNSTSGWVNISATIPIVASQSGATKATLQIAIGAVADNSAGSTTVNLAAGSAVYLVDSVGLALVASAHPNGRMPGLSPLIYPVRFTKGVQMRDAGIADGQKTYHATFEVTEL